jgi:ribosomal protein S18 acetylase RimI-like enzyme
MTPEALFALGDATWPAETTRQIGGWLIREAPGAGSRVNAATGEGDLEALEAAQTQPLVMVRDGQGRLDAALDARGYRVLTPVVGLAAPVSAWADPPPPVTAFAAWPPLAEQIALWDDAGIGAARRAVMGRAAGAKAALLGRVRDRPAGVGFVACHGDGAMLHALSVRPDLRRNGLARHLLSAAAHWAAGQGATWLGLFVERDNAAALALYRGAGMAEVTGYHYRIRR